MPHPSHAPAPGGHDVADERLLERYARTREPALRGELVERFLPLARFAASRYAAGSEPFDDLQQVASIGLLNAIDRFDPEGTVRPSARSRLPTMHGELRRHFRDRSWAVRPPRDPPGARAAGRPDGGDASSTAAAACRPPPRSRPPGPSCRWRRSSTPARRSRRGRAPSRCRAPRCSTTTAPVTGPGEHGVIDDGYARAEERGDRRDAAAGALTRREREIVRLRYEDDLTQSQIGEGRRPLADARLAAARRRAGEAAPRRGAGRGRRPMTDPPTTPAPC